LLYSCLEALDSRLVNSLLLISKPAIELVEWEWCRIHMDWILGSVGTRYTWIKF